jgi:hypothetical protein
MVEYLEDYKRRVAKKDTATIERINKLLQKTHVACPFTPEVKKEVKDEKTADCRQ